MSIIDVTHAAVGRLLALAGSGRSLHQVDALSGSRLNVLALAAREPGQELQEQHTHPLPHILQTGCARTRRNCEEPISHRAPGLAPLGQMALRGMLDEQNQQPRFASRPLPQSVERVATAAAHAGIPKPRWVRKSPPVNLAPVSDTVCRLQCGDMQTLLLQ